MNQYIVHPVGLVNLSRDDNQYSNDYYVKSTSSYKYDDYMFNVCYMNSSIQCLFHLKKFANFILEGKGTSLLIPTRNLLISMINWKENKKKSDLSVEEIKKEMGRIDERYNHNRQEDANEFISNFLDALREETSEKGIKKNHINLNNFSNELEMEAYKKFYNKFYEKKGYSFLLDLFYGNYITKKFCKKCKNLLSVKFNAFNMIELPIYELAKNRYSLNLDDILKSFFSESKIYDSKCDKCHEEVYSQTSIYKLPENLIIFFGRTANEQYINNKINYDKILDLSKFLDPNSNSKFNTYSLSGIIYYTSFGKKGFSGHYTASCKCQDVWYHFDDTIVSNSNYDPDSNEIILFYEKFN